VSTKPGAIPYEQFEVAGDKFLDKVRELLHQGNVRRVILKREDGTNLFEVPVRPGLAVTAATLAFAPVLVAVGAIAAVVSEVPLVAERQEDESDPA